MTETICPFCEIGVMDEVPYNKNTIELKKMVCSNCRSESVPLNLHDENLISLLNSSSEQTENNVQ